MATVTHPSFKEVAGPRVTALIEYILEKYEVVEPGTGTVPTLDTILQDEGLQRMIINMGEELQKEDEEAEEEGHQEEESPKKTTAEKSSPNYRKSRRKDTMNAVLPASGNRMVALATITSNAHHARRFQRRMLKIPLSSRARWTKVKRQSFQSTLTNTMDVL